jgi:thiol-disulfide isomerase/thioredoxin
VTTGKSISINFWGSGCAGLKAFPLLFARLHQLTKNHIFIAMAVKLHKISL